MNEQTLRRETTATERHPGVPDVTGRRRGPWLWAVALVMAAALGVLFGWWAFVPPQPDEAVGEPATVDVTEMTVGRSLPLAVSARWEARPLGVSAASGVLTSLEVADGDTVASGDLLFTVDLRPVVAAVGDVPAFRDLTRGARGDDVAQLQRLLAAAGHFSGDADGVFGPATTHAVRAWQRELGVERDGVVRAGDVVFATRLPARVRLADEIGVGTRLAPGDVVLSVLDGAPEFVARVPLTSDGDPSRPIQVTFGEEAVDAVVATTRDDMSGQTLWTLTRPDGEPVCGDRCDEVPLDESEAVYPTRQVLAPEVTGPGVPAAAVWFTAGGDPYVVLPDGTEQPVTIVGEGQGGVVLDGVDVGTTVVLAADTEAAQPAGGS